MVLAVMAGSLLLGGIYYATAPRYYSAEAAVQISQTSNPTEKTTSANDESVRRNTMPTFENVFRSARVIQGALARLPAADRVDLEGIPETQWNEAIQKRLTAKAIRSTNIIEVGYTSKDPGVAAHLVNAVVESFLAFTDDTHKGTTQQNLGLLMAEQQTTVKKLTAARTRLLEARRGCDMVMRSDSKSLPFWEERVVYFNNALTTSQKEHMELQAAMTSIQESLATGRGLGQEILTLSDTLGRDILASVLGTSAADANTQVTLEQNLVKDRADLRMLQQHLGPAHPDIVVLEERIRLGEESLRMGQDRVRRRATELGTSELGPWLVQVLQQRLAQVGQKESRLQQKFDEARAQAKSLGGQLAEVEVLQHEEEQLGRWNEKLQDRIAELSVSQKGQEVRTAVIQEPVVSAKPTSPRLGHVVLMTLLSGFGFALALVHILDLLDDRFSSLEELQARLGMPVLAMVQGLKPVAEEGLRSLSMCSDPMAMENEAFRTLRTAVSLIQEGARQIVITSSEPGDGKTTILANLAIGYAMSEKRTLVIDADMRRPGMTRLMQMQGTQGLSEIIRGEGEVSLLAAAHVRPSGFKGLDVLPCGPRSSNPAELLANPRFSQLLAWAASAYDQVFIDAPPVMAASDAAAIGRLVDGILFVVRPAKNRRRLILRVVESFRTLKLPLIGVVVNRVGSDDERRYYGYHDSGYGYGTGYGYRYASRDDDGEPSAAKSEPPNSGCNYRMKVSGQTKLIVPRRRLDSEVEPEVVKRVA